MGFEMPIVSGASKEEKEKKQPSRLKGAVAGAVLSMGVMAGQASEAQAAPAVENQERMEQIASGTLSHSKEMFVVGMKQGAVALEAQKGKKLLEGYSCDDIKIQIGGQVFTCEKAHSTTICGVPVARISATGNDGRWVQFSFFKSQPCMNDVVPQDSQGKNVYHYYDDSKYENVAGPLHYRDMKRYSDGEGASGTFPIDGMQLKGMLEKYR